VEEAELTARLNRLSACGYLYVARCAVVVVAAALLASLFVGYLAAEGLLLLAMLGTYVVVRAYTRHAQIMDVLEGNSDGDVSEVRG
jgi:hypothetical protein